MNDLNGLDLELRLRDHYRTMDVSFPGSLTPRVLEGMDRLPTARRWPVLRLPRRMAAAAAIAVVGLAVTAVVAGPLWFGSTVPAGPSTSPSASATVTPTPTGSTTGNPSLTQTPAASVSIGTPDPSALLASARASDLGRMGSGGAWAVQGTEFERIPDAGNSYGESPWPASDTEPPAVFVLDKDSAWTVTMTPGSVPFGQDPPYDHLNVVVNRSQGGVPWKQASVPGDYSNSQLAITFANPLVGYMIASPHEGAAGSTVLTTRDGGATWSVVARVALQFGGLGAELAASDAETLWAGGQGESKTAHPLLAVSRDSGRTWSEVTLPGLEGQWAGDGSALAVEPPVFINPSVGFFTVLVNGVDPEVFSTTDAGRTWRVANFPAGLNVTAVGNALRSGADFVDATHWFAAVGSAVQLTSDAGKTWESSLGQGLPAGKFVKLAFVDATTGYGLFQPAGGADSYLYRTSNGGSSWGLQYTSP